MVFDETMRENEASVPHHVNRLAKWVQLFTQSKAMQVPAMFMSLGRDMKCTQLRV
jgi:hypothetical protein